jgi:hypothetical protein
LDDDAAKTLGAARMYKHDAPGHELERILFEPEKRDISVHAELSGMSNESIAKWTLTENDQSAVDSRSNESERVEQRKVVFDLD